MPRPRVGALSDDARLTSDVCLSRTLGLNREQRPRKTKIGTEVLTVAYYYASPRIGALSDDARLTSDV